ncbi:hypothetical protein CDAR_8861 [Caerostris darwini]|uniref:Uncharacterized protein n=1 Tax=Caerostris darwini TaxID=1538125 RepID=A0AAV4R334_9ARAC|nr:hypothetical protein CDAR_8861 [Caerostris darwini]
MFSEQPPLSSPAKRATIIVYITTRLESEPGALARAAHLITDCGNRALPPAGRAAGALICASILQGDQNGRGLGLPDRETPYELPALGLERLNCVPIQILYIGLLCHLHSRNPCKNLDTKGSSPCTEFRRKSQQNAELFAQSQNPSGSHRVFKTTAGILRAQKQIRPILLRCEVQQRFRARLLRPLSLGPHYPL